MSSIELSARSFLRVYLESISWTILALTGFLGNILVFAALARNPILRRYTPIYVNVLAISDILNFLTNGVFVGVTLVSGQWQFGRVGCSVCGFSVLFMTHVTVGTMSFTAINRYVRVTRPELFKKIFTPRKSLTAMIIVWVFFALTPLPIAFEDGFAFNANYAVCVPSSKHKVYTMASFGVFITLSLLTVFFSYCRVSRTIKRIQPRQAPKNEDGDGTQVGQGLQNGETIMVMRMREVNITKIMYAIVLAFVMLWIPVLVLIITTRASLGRIPRDISLLVPYACNISSLINPVLYTIMNRSFRKEFKTIMLSLVYCKYCRCE